MTTNVFDGPFLAVPVWAVGEIRDFGQPRDLQVLLGLVALMERQTKEIAASITQIADYVGVSKETAKRSLKWLADHKIITVIHRQKPLVNVYTVHYIRPVKHGDRVMGDPMMGSQETLYGVTEDPMVGSRVTLSTSTKDQHNNTFSNPYIKILNRSTKEILKKAASGTEGKMILGSDPDNPVSGFELPVKKKVPRKTNQFVNHFLSNRHSIMSSSHSPKDLMILRKAFSTLIDSGLTEFTIMQMITKFFSVQRWREAENIVLLFCTKDIQQKLMEQVETTVDSDNPVLLLMMNDFERLDLDLPWPETMDLVLKKVVIRRGMDACYRYPEIVAKLITIHNGAFYSDEFSTSLSALNSIIRVISGEEQEDPTPLLKEVAHLELPDELLNLSSSSLRLPAGSIVEAVYNYRRATHGRK